MNKFIKNKEMRFHKYTGYKILVVGSFLFALSLNAYAEKKIERAPTSITSFEHCLLDGGESRESANHVACCSSPTVCVVCEKGAGGTCENVSASKLNTLGFREKAPGSVIDSIAPPTKSTTPRNRLKKDLPPVLPEKNKTSQN